MLFEALKSDAFGVLAIHEGKIAGFTGARWFLNDDEVSLGAQANNEQNVITPDSVKYGHNSDHVYVDFRVGDFPNTSYAANSPNVLGAGDPTILPAESWDDSFRGDGIASIALRYVADSPKKQSGDLPQRRRRSQASRPTCCRSTTRWLNGTGSMGDPSTWNWSHNSALCLLAFLVDPRSFSMGLSFARRIAPTIQYWIDAANVCDSQVEVSSVTTHTLEAETGGAVNHLKFANVNGLKVGQTVTVGVNSADVEMLTVEAIGGTQGPGEVFFTTNIVHSHPSGDEVAVGRRPARRRRRGPLPLQRHRRLRPGPGRHHQPDQRDHGRLAGHARRWRADGLRRPILRTDSHPLRRPHPRLFGAVFPAGRGSRQPAAAELHRPELQVQHRQRRPVGQPARPGSSAAGSAPKQMQLPWADSTSQARPSGQGPDGPPGRQRN